MEADPIDVEMEFHMENQHEHENINTIEASDEWKHLEGWTSSIYVEWKIGKSIFIF